MANSAIQSQPIEVDPVIIPGSLRNKIINGQFDIWQRGVNGFFGPQLPAQFNVDLYTADRWIWTLDDDGGAVSIAPQAQFLRKDFLPGQTDVPNNPKFFMRGDDIVITGGGGTEFSDIQQRVEDVNTFSGKTVTVSFYVRSFAPSASLMISIQQFFGQFGASAPVDVQPQVIAVSGNPWQRHVIVFDVPSVSGKTITAGSNLRVRFANIVGPTIAASLSVPVVNTPQFDLVNIQIEECDIDDPEFEDRPVSLELRLCQRFYEIGHRDESMHGVSIANSQIDHMWINFKVEKQVPPTVVFNPAEDPPTSSHLLPATHFVSQIETNGFRFDFDTLAGPRDVNVRSVDNTGLNRAPWTADAEL